MVVRDHDGARVGIILRTGERSDGQPAVMLQDNGAQFRVRTSRLRLNAAGNEAITSLSRAQIRTAAILNTE